MPTIYEVEHLHQPDGWLSPGYLEVDDRGMIARVSDQLAEGEETQRLAGFGVPGLSNLHSHAFQRGLTGRTEQVTGERTEDNLWTWREQMYRFVDRLTPEDYETIASLAYLEMLEFGFTAVCEFHYVHHQRGGDSYDNPAEMSDRLIAAADRTGLGLTLLPVLYVHGGIGKPPEEAQRRFVHGVDEYLVLLDTLRGRRGTCAKPRVGAALHSLRAVAPDEVHAALAGVNAIDPVARVHIHVSETTQEVTEVEAALGARPVQWLLDNAGLDDRWCLVHATHLDAAELAGTAASGAVAGLCPVTEANLGDGFFSLPEYHAANGRWGIGTDGQCSTSIAAELRMLEYGKRLELKRRNVIARPADGPGAHSGRVLFDSALAGGEQASGQGGGALVPGRRADLVMLDGDRNVLLGHGPQTALDAWILGGTQNPVRDVMVAGKWIIRDGQHPKEAAICAAYRDCIARLAR
jgi:formimidoylglutamate deiminase